MAVIGQFTKEDAGYVGAIATLTVNVDPVWIVADEKRASSNAPSHRVYAGNSEIGVAWPKQDKAGNTFLNLKLDDPCFGAPIYLNLVRADDGEKYVLLWSRPDGKRAVV